MLKRSEVADILGKMSTNTLFGPQMREACAQGAADVIRADNDDESAADPAPEDSKFVAIGRAVKQGKFHTRAHAESTTFARRIANALNRYVPDRRGQ